MVEAELIAQAGKTMPSLHGIADVSGLGLGAAPAGQNAPLQPIEVAPVPPPPTPTTAANTQAWQASLRQDLQACSAQSFFDRPSSAWTARHNYYEPNNDRGRVREGPAKWFKAPHKYGGAAQHRIIHPYGTEKKFIV